MEGLLCAGDCAGVILDETASTSISSPCPTLQRSSSVASGCTLHNAHSTQYIHSERYSKRHSEHQIGCPTTCHSWFAVTWTAVGSPFLALQSYPKQSTWLNMPKADLQKNLQRYFSCTALNAFQGIASVLKNRWANPNLQSDKMQNFALHCNPMRILGFCKIWRPTVLEKSTSQKLGPSMCSFCGPCF